MHFTYREVAIDKDLAQGDVLSKTSALLTVVADVHPYYAREDYTHFIVTTQSCDLVRGRTPSSSKYITLAPVRSLQTVIERAASPFQSGEIAKRANVLGDKARAKLLQFLERLLNNNETDYFYLHQDPASGLVDNSCAFLRLMVSLKTEHYDVCREARLLGLQDQFQAKLGWLVGNIYSRIGTDDWLPHHVSKDEWANLLKNTLEENIVFVSDKKLQSASKRDAIPDFENKSTDELRDLIAKFPEKKKKDEVIDAVIEELVSANLVDGTDPERMKLRLQNSPALASLLKS